MAIILITFIPCVRFSSVITIDPAKTIYDLFCFFFDWTYRNSNFSCRFV